MRAEKVLSFPVFGLTVYGQGLLLALAALVSLFVLHQRLKKTGNSQALFAVFAVLSVPMALFFARAFFALARPDDVFVDAVNGDFLGIGAFFALTKGGLVGWGAVLGILLAWTLAQRLTRTRATDSLAVPLSVFIVFMQFSKILGGQGLGEMVEAPFLQRFPFAVPNAFDEWQAAIFMLEVLVALAMLFVTLKADKKGCFRGHLLTALLIPLMSLQLYLEPLRKDAVVSLQVNNFILLALPMLAAWLMVLAIRLTLLMKRRHSRWLWLPIPGLVAMALLVVAAQFYEKLPIDKTLLFGAALTACLAYSILMLMAIKDLASRDSA